MSQLNPTKRTFFEVDSLDNSSLLLAHYRTLFRYIHRHKAASRDLQLMADYCRSR